MNLKKDEVLGSVKSFVLKMFILSQNHKGFYRTKLCCVFLKKDYMKNRGGQYTPIVSDGGGLFDHHFLHSFFKKEKN